ncbi:Replication factor C subunit 1, partial [Araneus ventricosus]
GDKIKHLTLLSETADSICIGDIIDKQIRNGNNWSLLPTQAIFASVVPGELMKGHLRQMINFPAWLGKNSNRNHMDRVLQELHVHMRMR